MGLWFLFFKDFLYLLKMKKRGWNKETSCIEKVTLLNRKDGCSFKLYYKVNSC